jgi:putative transposase
MKTNTHSELYFHFSWSTKNRESTISAQWEDRLFGYIRGKCKSLGLLIKALNGIQDHVHLLVRARPHHAPADVAHDVKGASSHFVNSQCLQPKRFSWQEGYGVFSVSAHDVETVRRYIERQKEHHSQGTVRREWENCGDGDEDEDIGDDG